MVRIRRRISRAIHAECHGIPGHSERLQIVALDLDGVAHAQGFRPSGGAAGGAYQAAPVVATLAHCKQQTRIRQPSSNVTLKR